MICFWFDFMIFMFCDFSCCYKQIKNKTEDRRKTKNVYGARAQEVKLLLGVPRLGLDRTRARAPPPATGAEYDMFDHFLEKRRLVVICGW